MASDVDICNLALGYLGDAATVASINPPEGSAQASHCATFYPIALDSLLEMHDWGFATRRAQLALLPNPVSQWAYCYAAPNDLVNAISVLPATAAGDTVENLVGDSSDVSASSYTPQPYSLELSDGGLEIIYTNTPDALLRYVARVRDPNRFTPLFVQTLAASLASMLAGPVIKGIEGARMSAQWASVAFGQDGKSGLFGRAAASDSSQKRSAYRSQQKPGWQR